MTAPVFIVCAADLKSRMENTEGIYLDENDPLPETKLIIRDCAIAVENMILQAQHLGLSTCWTAWFEQRDMKEAAGLAGDIYVSGVLCVGYADEAPAARPRRSFEEVVHYETW